jgi:8-oxo-dGTP pyrophosphatase MutT (NUDIX family)
MISVKDCLLLIQSYKPLNSVEEAYKNDAILFLLSNSNPLNSFNGIGHITCSAWIVNKTRSKALLLKHRKLNKWIQPGGHISYTDSSLINAAYREAKEETGLTSIEMIFGDIFDIDVHKIIQNNEFPEHTHYDIRFLFQADDNEFVKLNEEESFESLWICINDLINCKENYDRIYRLAVKTSQIK